MVYKGINGSAPEYISSTLTYVSEKHERHTRSTALDLLHIPISHTSFFNRAFSVQGPKLWNSLPADIRNSPTVNKDLVSRRGFSWDLNILIIFWVQIAT